LAHWPISIPALRLSVAKVAVAASIGSSGVSRTITIRPASRASDRRTIALESPTMAKFRAGRDQVLDGSDLTVIVAVILAGGGASCAEFLRLGLAPSRILTKNGLVPSW
jgi:hypothetical protein